MGQDEEILLGAPLDEVECGKSGKPAAIAREIGKRPILAFGNSSGDYSMLNYAEGNPDHAGMGFFVVCDDTEREYGSDEKAAEYYDEVEKRGGPPSRWQMTGRPSMAIMCRRQSCREQRR